MHLFYLLNVNSLLLYNISTQNLDSLDDGSRDVCHWNVMYNKCIHLISQEYFLQYCCCIISMASFPPLYEEIMYCHKHVWKKLNIFSLVNMLKCNHNFNTNLYLIHRIELYLRPILGSLLKKKMIFYLSVLLWICFYLIFIWFIILYKY